MSQVAAAHQEIERLGASVIGIGPAARFQAEALREDGYPYPLFLDPPQAACAAVGLEPQSLLHFLFDLRSWLRYLRSLLRVKKQGRITGRYSNVPGLVIVDAEANPVYVYRGRGIGDYPPMEQMLQVLAGASLD